MPKKFLLAVITSMAVFLSLFASPAMAQSPWYAPSFQDFNQKVNGDNAAPASEIFGERYTQAQVFWIFHSLVGLRTDGGVAKCAANFSTDIGGFLACVQNPATSSNSPVLFLASLSDKMLGTRPASGINYIADQVKEFHIIPEANAQGFGFRTLNIVQSLWVASRNAAYALTTLGIIILAFMIMFRARISPQVVVTVQSAIPKVAIGLILITFSYAIAGLVIDLAYLIQGLIAAVLSTAGILHSDPIETFRTMNNLIVGLSSLSLVVFVFLFAVSVGVGGLAGLLTLGVGAVGGLVGIGIVLLAVVVIYVVGLVRIFWLLLQTYVKVLFLVAAGPIYILIGTITLKDTFFSWLKQIAAQMSVFVSVTLLVLVAHVFLLGMGTFIQGIANDGSLIAELINPYKVNAGQLAGNFATFPGFGGNGVNADILGLLIAIAVLVSIPKLASSIRDYMITGKAVFGFDIGGAIAPGRIAAGIGLDRYLSQGAPGQKLAALEAAAKATPSAANIRAVSQEQARQEAAKNLIKGRFGR